MARWNIGQWLAAGLIAMVAGSDGLAGEERPGFLQDRGTGVASSMFATYIERGQVVVYPFYEFYYDGNAEYEPADFGLPSTQEYRGKSRAHEGLIFLGIGLTDWLIWEFEAAVITERFEKSGGDTSAVPAVIEESGLGDVETQLRWRWMRETDSRPEVFSYFETVFPLQKDRDLIGTADWEYKLALGLIKGFRWGTLTLRSGVEYVREEDKLEAGEFALEYMKRLSPRWRVFSMIEGTQDEVELVSEAQLHFGPRGYVKAGTGVGLTSKATDIAPEIGVMLIF